MSAKTGRKRRIPLREEHFDDVESNPPLKRCKYCGWQHVDNATRLQEHLVKKHEAVLAAARAEATQALITRYGDRHFSSPEQNRAERALVLMQVL